MAAISSEEAKPEHDGEGAEALERTVFTSAMNSANETVERRTTRFGRLEIPEAEAARLSDAAIANRLVEIGVSRLSAARIVAVVRGTDEAGRARPHPRAGRGAS